MRSSRLLAVAVPLVVFVVYLLTLYPTVGWVDCGEIAAGCHMLNVLHPTGYPLFTLIGYLFSHLPFGTVVTRVNTLSAVLSSLAALFCYLAVVRLTRSSVAGIVTAALYAFSSTVWSNSVDADVFGLTALFTALTIYLVVGLTRPEGSTGSAPLNLAFVAYLLGLALTNHMSFASTFVGAAVGLVLFYRREVLKPRVLLPLVLFFLLGLTPYLYLLVRSHAQPVFNWGDAHNLERLVWHVTGKQFQVWMFSLPIGEVVKNLGQALAMLGQELYYVFVPVMFWGAWVTLRKRREVFWLLAVLFVLNLFYAINYSIPDIQSYYIPFMIAAFIFSGVGLGDLMVRTSFPWSPFFVRILTGIVPYVVFAICRLVVRRLRLGYYLLSLLAIVPIAVNLRRGGAQGNFIAEDFARNHLKSTPENAIVFTTNWDIYSPMFYLRQINRERPDVCIIDKELLRRSWYFQSLEQEYPWLIERSRPEVERFREFLDQFEHNTLRDARGIQDAFIAMLNSFVTRNPERRSFVTFDGRGDQDAKEMLPAYRRIPYGLYYELSPEPTTDSFDYGRFVLRRAPQKYDERTRHNLFAYERFALERASYLLSRERRDEARSVLDWLAREFPGSRTAAGLRQQLDARSKVLP